MEVIDGVPHTAFPMDDASRVGEVRRHAARLSAQQDWGEVDAGRLALVVTELATNLLRHATGGRLLIAARAERSEVELLAIDRGPGIPDLDRCLGDGYSTGSTPGTGLGAVRRLSQQFDLHSSVPEGTIVLARLRKAGGPAAVSSDFEVGAVCLPAPGETVSGDAWAACLQEGRAALIVADGLGHGPDAHKAARAALDVFSRRPFADLREGLREAHQELRTTRGAAVTLLQLDATACRIRATGAGNVLARIISGVTDRTLLSQHGTVGVQIRSPDEVAYDWPAHAILVVYTDGIESRWDARRLLPVLGRDPVMAAAILVRDHLRGRDDATVVVARRRA